MEAYKELGINGASEELTDILLSDSLFGSTTLSSRNHKILSDSVSHDEHLKKLKIMSPLMSGARCYENEFQISVFR